MYQTDTDYKQENESADDNNIYFTEKDFCQPPGILHENKATDDSEYVTDDDKIPPLECIPDYDSNDDSVPPLEPILNAASSHAHELLATDTATLDVTPILKQDIDYHLELVIAIPCNFQSRQFIFLHALIDSRSNKSHAKYNKIPKWIHDQATLTADQAPFIRWGSEFKADQEVILPFRLTQFTPNRKIEHSILLSQANTHSSTSPDLILGCNVICKLGLKLNFRDDTPVILWDDVAVPMVHCGQWTPARIDEAFATASAPPSLMLQCAEDNFNNKSPSMLAADYHEVKIDDMLLTHLNCMQCHALWHVLKKHAFLFSGKLSKLPGKPVHLELTDLTVKPYHGKPYQVPRSLLPLLNAKVECLCDIGVLQCTNNSEWAAQGFAVLKKNNQIHFVTDFRMLNCHLC